MPRELYNEGRVVGLSTYELYVKHALSENPSIEPASEREWLASQIGHGASMILHIPVESDQISGVHCIEVELPENSKLCAANTIIGSQFFGDCVANQQGWVTRIKSYGSMLPNSSNISPDTYTVSNDSDYKITVEELSASEQSAIANYLKIQDAIVIQPGLWEEEIYAEEGENLPVWDLIPNLKKVPTLRITLSSKITHDFYLLLTGFTNRSIISGISGFDSGSVNTDNPEDGDFIGPESYPWANKVILTSSTVVDYYLRKNIQSHNDFLKIEVNEDSLSTDFTVSPLNPVTGISMYGPTTPGGPVEIGSRMEDISEVIPANKQGKSWATSLNPYNTPYRDSRDTKDSSKIYSSDVYDSSDSSLNITQTSSTEEDAVVTTIKHSQLKAGTGISISGPSTPGGDILISSRIEPYNTNASPDNKMLKVAIDSPIDIQDPSTAQPHISPKTVAEGVRTRLKVSKPVNRNDSKGKGGVRITYPVEAGNDMIVEVPITSNFLSVSRTNPEVTVLKYKAGGISDSTGILTFKESNGKCVVSWDFAKLANKLAGTIPKKTLGITKLDTALKDLLQHVIGVKSGLMDENGNILWANLGLDNAGDFKIPCGNLNIYSKTTSGADRWIKSHTSAENGDLRVK